MPHQRAGRCTQEINQGQKVFLILTYLKVIIDFYYFVKLKIVNNINFKTDLTLRIYVYIMPNV